MGNRDRDWYANRHSPPGEYQCVDTGMGLPQSDGLTITGPPETSTLPPPPPRRPITVLMVAVFMLCLFHVLLGLVAVAIGVAASIQAEVWLAHTVSPIWSGVFVSNPCPVVLLCLSLLTNDVYKGY